MVLMSMYFDDATMQDWSDSAAGTQLRVGEFMSLLGSPWAKEKSQQCSRQGDFLGLVHDLSDLQAGTIRFWPREALITTVINIIDVARSTGLQWSGGQTLRHLQLP